MALQPNWKNTNIALFSENILQQRSWCFWSKEEHPLQHLVQKSWQKITFKSVKFSKTEIIAPYQYHFISGEVFFNYFQDSFLPQNKNIVCFNSRVNSIKKNNDFFDIHSHNINCQSKLVFSSLPATTEAAKGRIELKQHFKGWFIKMEEAVFDESTVTLMDFSIAQCDDTRFVYILPFSNSEALIEMTVFSPYLYDDSVYDNVLNDYIALHFAGIAYTVQQTERGTIPMSDALFSRFGATGEILLGTSAGMVKASTGYAFARISRDSQRLAKDVSQRKKLRWSATKGRFRFYDKLLLGIIADEPLKGSIIFEALFKRIPAINIFRFLDEETSLAKDILIFSQLPFIPFLKQIYRQWLR